MDSGTQYHIYQYLEYSEDGNYGSKTPWYGNEYVTYQNLVDGGIEAGAPYLELFPDGTGDILEIRIEQTSFYSYNGIYAGNYHVTLPDSDYDPGSTEAEMSAALGAPDSTIVVAAQADIDWTNFNNLYKYDGDTYGYIHYYKPQDQINCRIFLAKMSDGVFHIIALYIQDYSQNP